MRMTTSRLARAVLALGALSLSASCGSGGGGDGDGGGGGDGDGCVNLECQQVTCPAGGTTSISGVVNIPSGDLPLPNVVVYVPNAPIAPIVQGASCDRCGEELSGSPLVQTRTNTRGEFTLENMPVGEDIPIVVQVGKWRRHVTIPAIAPCVDHPLDADEIRLPSTRDEGDIPRIALTTGGADALECLLRKIGLADSEFTPETGPGRVNFFYGGGGTRSYATTHNGGAPFTNAYDWWDDVDNLLAYDIVVHSCEGGSRNDTPKRAASKQALQAFADVGGRVFLSHWHNAWLVDGTDDFQSVATWNFRSNPSSPTTGTIDQTFEKGRTLAEWMFEDVVAGSTTLGELRIVQGRRTLDQVTAALAQRWISIVHSGVESVQYMSFNTPVPAPDEEKCGRVVFSDIHVSSGDNSSTSTRFPGGCTTVGLTPQEKALVFMLFDISGCIEPDVVVD
jgi:hypothetical protein